MRINVFLEQKRSNCHVHLSWTYNILTPSGRYVNFTDVMSLTKAIFCNITCKCHCLLIIPRALSTYKVFECTHTIPSGFKPLVNTQFERKEKCLQKYEYRPIVETRAQHRMINTANTFTKTEKVNVTTLIYSTIVNTTNNVSNTHLHFHILSWKIHRFGNLLPQGSTINFI